MKEIIYSLSCLSELKCLWNTKGEFEQNVHTVLSHTMSVYRYTFYIFYKMIAT